jgi:serralysin
MANMTPQEQLMLELINRARMDPAGEAKRMGIKLNEGVSPADKISNAPKQVLAGNDSLQVAADNHSAWMIAHDRFSHNEQIGTSGFSGASPSNRMTNAGYPNFSTAGENISFRGSTGNINLTNEIIQQHADLFIDAGIQGRGHRTNIMAEGFREVGIGQQTGNFDGFNASMVTQDFAARNNTIFITGVVYNDTVKKDNFFSVGEQVSGFAVNGGTASDTTGTGGGYELQYTTAGAKTVSFGGGISADVALGNANLKVDLVNGDEIWTNATLTAVSDAVTEIHLLGIGKANISGADTGQEMYANAGKNVFEGNGGADSFVFTKGTTGKTENKADRILDFSRAEGDAIDLSRWDANSNRGGNQDFDFIGKQNFHGEAGELRYINKNGATWIQGDTDGDRKVDLMIRLDGVIKLNAGDFDF